MYVYVKTKGTSKTKRFTEFAWKGMGKRERAKYDQITEEQAKRLNASNSSGSQAQGQGPIPPDVETQQKYQTLVDQGKGFEKDEKFEKALEKYTEAEKVKTSPYIKGVIAKLTKKVESIKLTESEESDKKKQYQELIDSGDEATKDDDPVMALEFYESAQKIDDTEEVQEKIKQTKKELDSE